MALFVAANVAASSMAWAQSDAQEDDAIEVGGVRLRPEIEIRSRAETRRDPPELGGRSMLGLESPRVRSAATIGQRSRLGLGVEQGPVGGKFLLQDARTFGNASTTGMLSPAGSSEHMGAFETYADVHTKDRVRPSFVRVGRQRVRWGDGRLVSDADYSPMGRSLDAVRAVLEHRSLTFEGLGAVLGAPQPTGIAYGQTAGPFRGGSALFGTRAAWVLDHFLAVEALGLLRMARQAGAGLDGSRFRTAAAEGDTWTIDLRASGRIGAFAYGAEGAYQFGKASGIGPSGTRREATAGAVYVQETLRRVVMTPTIRASASYASGDDGQGAYKQFDPLLPDVHVHHGTMDLFAWSNLVDASGRVTIEPIDHLDVSAEYRYMHLASSNGEWIHGYLGAVGTPTGSGETELGHEIDLSFSIHPWAPLTLSGGYGMLVLGDGARTALAGRTRGAPQPNGTFAPSDLAHAGMLQVRLAAP